MTDDPARRYKELLGAAHEAARRHAEHERARVIALAAEIAEADRAVAEATKSATAVTDEVTAWWRGRVLTPTAGVSWIVPGAVPAPDPTADPALLNEYLAQIEPATKALLTALRKASWRSR